MLINEPKKIIIRIGVFVCLIILTITAKAEKAKAELNDIFTNKNISVDEFIFVLNSYVEIESNYILTNEKLVLEKLKETNLFVHHIDIYNLLANAFWYRNRKHKYQLYCSKADSILKKHPEYDFGKSSLMRLRGLYNNDNDKNKKDFSKSINFLDTALSLSIETQNKSLIARNYYSLGFIYWDNSMFSDAILNFKKSEEFYENLNAQYQIARIYNYYAIHGKNAGDLATSLDYYLRIERIYQSLYEEKRRAEILGKIGGIYADMGNFEDAMKMFNTSLSVLLELKAERMLPYAYERIGSLYLKMDNYSKAKYYFLKSIDLESKSGNKIRLNGLKINMIDIYINEKKYDKAIEILDESIRIYTKLSFTSGISTVYQRYAEIHYLQGNYKKAVETIKESIELALEVNNQLILQDAYLQLSKYYEKLGKYDLSLENYKLYKNYSDSVFNEENLLKVESLKTKFEIKEKEQEIEQLEAMAEIKNQQFQLTVLVLALLILIISMLYVYKRSREKTKHLKLLAIKNKELKDVTKKLEISNNFKSRLISNISHEIRTPLNIILGFTSTIDEKINPQSFKLALSEIQRSSDNLTRMIDSMLDISLLDSDKVKLKPEEFYSFELKKSVEQVIKHEFWKKNKTLSYNIACRDNFKIISDKNRIKQTLQQVIENSVKFTDDGKIEVDITSSRNSLSIKIKDTGIGIEEDKINQVFERFYKIENNKKLYRGAGLGLSISYEIIKLLNGKIEIDSEINKGTTFSISLPLKMEV